MNNKNQPPVKNTTCKKIELKSSLKKILFNYLRLKKCHGKRHKAKRYSQNVKGVFYPTMPRADTIYLWSIDVP